MEEDMFFLIDFAPVLHSIPRYYIELGTLFFVTRNLGRLVRKGTQPIDDRERSRGEESMRVILAERRRSNALYRQILMFLSQHQDDIEGIPFGDLLVRDLGYLKSMPRGEWFKKRKKLAAYVTRIREELSRHGSM
jgi:hypothetical protein